MTKGELRKTALDAWGRFQKGHKDESLEILRNIFQVEATYRTIIGTMLPTHAFSSVYGTPLSVQYAMAEGLVKEQNETLLDYLKFLWETRGREERNIVAFAIGKLNVPVHELLPLVKSYLAESGNWDTCDNLGARALSQLILAMPTEKLLSFLKEWVLDSNKWIRRGSCAALAELIKTHDIPDEALDIIDVLVKEEEDRDVQKGVAWALRNISKRFPEKVISCVDAWISESKTDRHTRWMIKNGMKKLPQEKQEQILKSMA